MNKYFIIFSSFCFPIRFALGTGVAKKKPRLNRDVPQKKRPSIDYRSLFIGKGTAMFSSCTTVASTAVILLLNSRFQNYN